MYLVYAGGCSRRETADVMKIACDRVEVLLSAERASATLHYSVRPRAPQSRLSGCFDQAA